MDARADTPDPRFLEGARLFDAGDYFEAHEVWEELWLECGPADRRFYQALIQAAVSLYHHSRGNATGAARLCASGKRYMQPFAPVFAGVDVAAFWRAMEARLAGASEVPQLGLGVPNGERHA
jgi:uncharacterized protein